MNYRFKQNIYELSKSEYIQEDWYYRIYTAKDKFYNCLRRNDAYEYYKTYKGIRIDIVYKNGDGVKTIVNCPNMDLERLRDDFSIKKTNKSTRKAIAKYDKENTKTICLKLNLNTDADIINYLELSNNKNGLIKELLRKEILQEQLRCMPIYQNSQEIRLMA